MGEAPDSAVCEKCKKKQDSAHIDQKNGTGTFQKLKDDNMTDKTEIK